MDEKAFNALAEAELVRIEAALDAAGLDVDVEPGGVLQVAFDDGSQMVINRHSAAREIWVAARQGGFHFRHDGGRWVGTREPEGLWDALSRLCTAQAGRAIALE